MNRSQRAKAWLVAFMVLTALGLGILLVALGTLDSGYSGPLPSPSGATSSAPPSGTPPPTGTSPPPPPTGTSSPPPLARAPAMSDVTSLITALAGLVTAIGGLIGSSAALLTVRRAGRLTAGGEGKPMAGGDGESSKA
jgi:hypothetical protein